MYEAPEIFELGDVDDLTLGPGAGNLPEGEDLWIRFPWPYVRPDDRPTDDE